jgi:hypothetical protein
MSLSSSTVPVAGFCLALDGALLVWAVMASPLPIDVLVKNALSGVAWFMLCVINGVIISDARKPYTFIACTVVMCVPPPTPSLLGG